MYEAELAKKQAEANKKKEIDSFDMTELSLENIEDIHEDNSTAIEVESLPTIELEDPTVTYESQAELIKVTFEAEEVNDVTEHKPPISAIEAHDSDWLLPTPPTEATEIPEVVEEEKPVKVQPKEDNTLQMSLF